SIFRQTPLTWPQESGAEKKKKKRHDTRAALAGSMLRCMQGATQGQEEELDQPSVLVHNTSHQPALQQHSALTNNHQIAQVQIQVDTQPHLLLKAE
ncbi:hypothetical protein AALO_G00175400, partial [Alosa alosa]